MNTLQKNITRFDFIDLLKGIGILLVVWGHTMTPRSIYIYSFHMPLFFFLSGFVHKEKPFKSFVVSKINTLYVPYIAFSLFSWVFYLIKYSSSALATHLPKLQSLFTGTADNGGNNPIWFLTCIFIISLLLWTINCFISHSGFKWGIIFMISLIGYYLSVNNLSFGFFQFDIALTGLVFYWLGYVIKEHNLLSYLDKFKTLQLVVFIIFVELLHILTAYSNVLFSSIRWVNLAGNVIGNYLLFYLSALLGITVFVTLGYKFRSIHFLNNLGMHTLIILGIHKPLLQVLKILMSSYVNTETKLYGFLASIIAIQLSILIGKHLNRFVPIVLGKKPLFKIPDLSGI